MSTGVCVVCSGCVYGECLPVPRELAKVEYRSGAGFPPLFRLPWITASGVTTLPQHLHQTAVRKNKYKIKQAFVYWEL